MMFNRVLVPLDGSSLSEEIVPYVDAISRSTGCMISMLRVASQERELAAASDYIRAVAEKFSGAAPQVSIDSDVAGAILREAEREPPALVAMTSHGRTGVPGVLFGSVAMDVLRRSRRPALIYRPGRAESRAPAEIHEITTVVLALDGSNFSERMESTAAQFAKWLGARLVVVQAIDSRVKIPSGIPAGDVLESSYVQQRADGIADLYGVAAEWDVLHGDASASICKLFEGRTDAILAITSHGRSGPTRAIFGSVASDCMQRGGVPVLIQMLTE